MWFVGIKHPYYPEIYLCESEQEARKKYKELFEENHRVDGEHNGFVTMGEVSELINIKTYY